MQKKFNKILVANRGEIAIRIFRACAELGIKSVGIYSKEDKYSLFRTKADESYLIGEDKGPIDVYLDMNECVDDGAGGVIGDYSYDGVHLKAEYYKLWTEWMKAHGIKNLIK